MTGAIVSEQLISTFGFRRYSKTISNRRLFAVAAVVTFAHLLALMLPLPSPGIIPSLPPDTEITAYTGEPVELTVNSNLPPDTELAWRVDTPKGIEVAAERVGPESFRLIAPDSPAVLAVTFMARNRWGADSMKVTIQVEEPLRAVAFIDKNKTAGGSRMKKKEPSAARAEKKPREKEPARQATIMPELDKLRFAWGVEENTDRPPQNAFLAENNSSAASPEPGGGQEPLPRMAGDTPLVFNLERLGKKAAEKTEHTGKLAGSENQTRTATKRADGSERDMKSERETHTLPVAAKIFNGKSNNIALASLIDDLDRTAAKVKEDVEKTDGKNPGASSKGGKERENTRGDEKAASRTKFACDLEFSTGQTGDLAFNARKDPLAVYLRDLRGKIETNWFNAISSTGRFSWPHGEVIVKMTIQADGEITDVTEYNAAVSVPSKYVTKTLEAVRKAGPYKPIPPEIGKESVTLTIRFLYW